MEKLPTDIVEDIFDRLPTEAALQAKRVSKTWRILLRSKTDKVGFLVSAVLKLKGETKIRLYYGDLYCDSMCVKMNYTYPQERLKCGTIDYDMIGSCNGLVCFREQCPYQEVTFLICNPLTGEDAYAPKPNTHARTAPYTRFRSPAERSWTTMSGFGYCHSTNEYKIVKLCYKEIGKTHVEVYTVGDREWRDKGSINVSELHSSIGVYANGALHWLHLPNSNNRDSSIMAFDLEAEKFKFIPLPCSKDVADYKDCPKLLGGNNNLYLVYTIYDEHCTEIWTYKRNKNSWRTNSWHWIREFRTWWEKPVWPDLKNPRFFEPLAMTRDDELLLRYGERVLYCYDLRNMTLSKLGEFFACKVNVIPHANSIVSVSSLKDRRGRGLSVVLGRSWDVFTWERWEGHAKDAEEWLHKGFNRLKNHWMSMK